MNDERHPVDLPVLARMTSRRETKRGSGHTPADRIRPQLIENRCRSKPPLEGTAPASLWLSNHERPLSVDRHLNRGQGPAAKRVTANSFRAARRHPPHRLTTRGVNDL
jgi:hypothetical protein